jgi:PleD family two-component response regulator
MAAEREYSAAGESFVVPVSLGCSLLRAEDDENTVLLRADQALYQAKQNGRNRVEWR